MFAASLRLAGRLHRTHPQLARVIMHSTGQMLLSGKGLAAHAVRDIVAAQAAGRFTAMPAGVAVACAAGCLVGLLHLFHQDPSVDVDAATDEMTAGVLRMFGMPADEAARLVAVPLSPARRITSVEGPPAPAVPGSCH